jgi:ornithine cyclodeaminase/alanine dehydrogenase
VLDAVLPEATYLELASGGVELPPKPGIHPRENAFIHAVPAYLRRCDVAAMKWSPVARRTP